MGKKKKPADTCLQHILAGYFTRKTTRKAHFLQQWYAPPWGWRGAALHKGRISPRFNLSPARGDIHHLNSPNPHSPLSPGAPGQRLWRTNRGKRWTRERVPKRYKRRAHASGAGESISDSTKPATVPRGATDTSSRSQDRRGPDSVNGEPELLGQHRGANPGPPAEPRRLSTFRFLRPPKGSAPRRNCQLSPQRPTLGTRSFLGHLAPRLKIRLDSLLAQHTTPKTLPLRKQKALWPKNVAKPPSFLSSRCDKHPTKWRQRRHPTTP